MATRYVRSTDGSDADDGSTWALAKATLTGVAAIDTAGDRIWVSDNHAETTAGAITIALAGTLADPTQVLCGDDAAEPPTALSTAGTISTTGANSITLQGNAYVCGLTFSAGSAASSAALVLNNVTANIMKFEDCGFVLNNTNGGSAITPGVASSITEFINCSFKFGAAAQTVDNRGHIKIKGGLWAAGTAAQTIIFEPSGSGPLLEADGIDFSNLGSTVDLVTGGGIPAGTLHFFRNCKLPASWSGDLVSSALTNPISRVEMWNCDSGDTNYRMWIETYTGSIKSETTLVKTGGASDGDTPLSWKMASNTISEYPLNVLRSPEIFSERITSVGSAKTITVDILHDSVTALKDDEIWLEVQYLGTSGFPLGLFVNDAKADVLAAGANQAASGATWTTTGMANPNKQKLEVTFTPQEKGVAIVTVCMAKASYTVYVDRVAQVS